MALGAIEPTPFINKKVVTQKESSGPFKLFRRTSFGRPGQGSLSSRGCLCRPESCQRVISGNLESRFLASRSRLADCAILGYPGKMREHRYSFRLLKFVIYFMIIIIYCIVDLTKSSVELITLIFMNCFPKTLKCQYYFESDC